MHTIDQLICDSCLEHPEAVALQQKSGAIWTDISYQSLWSMADKMAANLSNNGIVARDHVAILAPSSVNWVACYLGILRNSGVVVPVDKELKSSELRHNLADSEAKLIFVGSQELGTLLSIIDDLPLLKKIVLIDKAPLSIESQSNESNLLSETADLLESLLEENRLGTEQQERIRELSLRFNRELQPGKIKEQRIASSLGSREDLFLQLRSEKRIVFLEDLSCNAKAPTATHTPEDCAIILYTSGTTGRSKGAMLSHINIVSNILAASKQFELNNSIHTLSFLPINHVFEQVCGVLLPLSLGGKVSFAESIKKLGENLAELKPSFLLGVPAVYRLLFDRVMKNINNKTASRILFNLPLCRKIVTRKVQSTFGKGTIFVSGGAALDPSVAAGFTELGLTLLQGYGITETSPVIAAETPSCRKAGTVGLPMEKIKIRIANKNAEGVGEIQVCGPNVMLGYFKNQQATDEAIKDGWYSTGDLGKIDQQGLLSICGRVKNLIVTPNGKNVYPEEVENQLLNSPYIAEVLVYGRKSGSGAEEVYASIFPCEEALFELQQRQGKSHLSPAEVELLIRQEVMHYGKDLADYKRVKKFSLRDDEFPKTTTRKIKRYTLEPSISAEE